MAEIIAPKSEPNWALILKRCEGLKNDSLKSLNGAQGFEYFQRAEHFFKNYGGLVADLIREKVTPDDKTSKATAPIVRPGIISGQ